MMMMEEEKEKLELEFSGFMETRLQEIIHRRAAIEVRLREQTRTHTTGKDIRAHTQAQPDIKAHTQMKMRGRGLIFLPNPPF